MSLTRYAAKGHQPIGYDGDSGWSGGMSEVPVALLQNLLTRPLPITIGGSNNGTFTLNASVTKPVPIWNAEGFTLLKSTVVYTWNATSNPILTSAGATSTDVDSVLGIWYMYLDSAGDTLFPSQTAPSFVEAAVDYPAQLLGHPGTSRADNYRYVGWMRCTTAATPAFLAATKVGYTYHFAEASVATGATWAALDFTASVPAIEGIQVAGRLETGVVGSVVVSGSSVEDQGVLHGSAVGLANNIIDTPFGPIESDGSGQVYAKDTVARGDVHISQVVDLV